ncbi:heavy metal translocating P-type ATPase [Roseiflexus sp. RS-1]|uniref:heavy metal translocating P-type ATPase n=1 Tax=Roseiflexus sp. (strain RS-1) TaxID=357808 RepID=UPI0000D81776|nr:heavy metal translocating P-type ATPase [Roseiflexus sp. RS-1]ABQ88888.1 heavy metal translocating P-type ATPase [Roseiflexus sp. RS-1]
MSTQELITQLRTRPGVLAVHYDEQERVLTLRYDGGRVNVADIEALARSAGATLRMLPAETRPLTPEEAELAALPWMIRLTTLTLVMVIVGWVVEDFTTLPRWVAWLSYAVAYASGGFYSIQEAWETLRKRQFDVNFLMIVAAVGAAIVGQPREGAILMFLFSLSGTLETYAMGRTHASIRALLDMTPKEAEVYRDGTLVRVPVEEVQVGEIVLVRPGAQVPADGVVVRGESALNEASITGESMPVEKRPGAKVFAGTINGQGALEVRVTTSVENSTLARIVQVVREAREQKAKSQDFTDRVIGQYYAYAVVGLTLLAIIVPLLFLGWDLKTTLYRAMTLMVVASPCALVISIPAALLSALASAARGGVLFKGGRHLEAAAQVRVVAFDKTGTLTTGRPGVVAVIPVDGAPASLEEAFIGVDAPEHPAQAIPDDQIGPLTPEQRWLLALAAAIERPSEHPLARAIVRGADERGLPVIEASGFEALTGAGAAATIHGQRLTIGRPMLFDLSPDLMEQIATQQELGRTVVALGSGRTVWGIIAIADTVRPEAAAAVARLKRTGIERVVLLTGDNHQVAQAIGQALGVDEVHAELLPEQKVAVLRELEQRYGPVAMIGDGVNDAPALASATLGVAMGAAGTDVALESADMLLMSDDLSRLPGALRLARRARAIVRQNLAFAFTVIAVLMVFAMFGAIPLTLGVIGHEGSTLIVVANGLRLLAERIQHG